jgi:hypothetical protein
MLQILSNINENNFITCKQFPLGVRSEFLSGNLAQEEMMGESKVIEKSEGRSVIGIIDDIRSREYNEDSTFRSGMASIWPLISILKFRTDQCNINFDVLIKFVSPLIENKKVVKHSDYNFEFINNYSLPLYADLEGCFAVNKFFEEQKPIAKLIEFDTVCKTIIAQGI